MVKKARARLFGSWEMNWMAYTSRTTWRWRVRVGAGSLGFLMYPQAENGRRAARLPCPVQLKIRITSRETAFYKRVTDDGTTSHTHFATELGPARTSGVLPSH